MLITSNLNFVQCCFRILSSFHCSLFFSKEEHFSANSKVNKDTLHKGKIPRFNLHFQAGYQCLQLHCSVLKSFSNVIGWISLLAITIVYSFSIQPPELKIGSQIFTTNWDSVLLCQYTITYWRYIRVRTVISI